MEMPSMDNADALGLARENYRLALENNAILKKMEKRYVRGFWLKLVGFIVFFILPLLLIPYLMNSYLDSLGMSSGMDSMFGTEDRTSNAQKVLDLLQNNSSNPR
jgi:hypothetical protein